MDEFRQTLGRLREVVTQWLEPNALRPVDAGAVVREQVVRLLKRRDLRIAAEALLGDLRNAVTGYETFDHENQRHALEDAMRVIEKIEALIAGERVLNPDRIDMPDPPAALGAQLKNNLDKIRQEARTQKDRLQRESQAHRFARRPVRTPVKPPVESPAGPAERGGLSFTDSVPGEHTRRNDRRPYAPQHRRPGQGNEAHHPPKDGPSPQAPQAQNPPKPKPPGGPQPQNQQPRGPANAESGVDQNRWADQPPKDGAGEQVHHSRHRRHRRKKT
jgi:hypothetical protein